MAVVPFRSPRKSTNSRGRARSSASSVIWPPMSGHSSPKPWTLTQKIAQLRRCDALSVEIVERYVDELLRNLARRGTPP